MKIATIVATFLICLPCLAGNPGAPTRQVVGGDLIYRAIATSPNEAQAVQSSETRAAHLLAIECSALPRETRVDHQTVARQADSSYLATTEVSAGIVDCEKLRHASSALRDKLAHPSFAVAAPAPRVIQQAAAAPLPELIWTHHQEISHLQAINSRLQQRLKEREALRP